MPNNQKIIIKIRKPENYYLKKKLYSRIKYQNVTLRYGINQDAHQWMMNKENMVCIHYGLLLSHSKE